MTTPRRLLPDRPSRQHLRKQAKRFAKARSLQLAAAQRALAHEYGFSDWAALMSAVEPASQCQRSPLSLAAARADVAQVRALLAQGANVEGERGEIDSPLFVACDSAASAAERLATVQALVEAGAFVRRGCTGGATPLHAAARRGPAALVELLLRSGALHWQGDEAGKRPFDYARDGAPIDRDRILFLCADGPRITDGVFLDAVGAIQRGDVAALSALLDAHPRLLRERAIEPDFGPRGYFSDPKLFWFVANNPTLVPESPANIALVAETMIAKGVEQSDLDYALELTATNAMMPAPQQIELMAALTQAGARARDMLSILGHRQTAAAAWLVDHSGAGMSAAIAAGLGRLAVLAELLAGASPDDAAAALAMAVINRQYEAARLCLETGADPNRFMPCHSHSTPLHQAALDGDVAMLKLLVAHGARADIEDKLWRGTALGWALHGGQEQAAAYLRSQTGDERG